MSLLITALLLGLLVVVVFWLMDQLAADANTKVVKVAIVVVFLVYLLLALLGVAPTFS